MFLINTTDGAPRTNDYFTEVSAGRVPGSRIVRLFGINQNISTSIQDVVAAGGDYSWLLAATPLEAISTSALDDVTSTGARTILVQGLDINFNEIFEVIEMNGLTASSPTTQEFMRVNKATVITSGTYAQGAAVGANEGDISIQVSGGGDIVATIINTLGFGQSTDFVYTVPAGKRLFIKSIIIDLDSNKVADIFGWVRPDADDVTGPDYTSKSMVIHQHALQGGVPSVIDIEIPFMLPEKTDVWASGQITAGTGELILNAGGVLEDM